MNLNFLPKGIFEQVVKLNLDTLYEIRLRVGYNLKVCSGDDFLVKSLDYKVKIEDIKEILLNITQHSLYAYNEQIKNGFITTDEGIRVGIAGCCVVDNDKIVTIKDISSLNVRIPHRIDGCSDIFFNHIIIKDKLLNTLIVSPPFLGKTTMLKDIARKINLFNQNILIVDERGEFSIVKGENIDVLSYSSKEFAFVSGIRALSPKIIITDELSTKSDWECVNSAVNSGITIIASCHAKNIKELLSKPIFIKNIFDRYVFLKDGFKAGVLDSIYDKDLNKL